MNVPSEQPPEDRMEDLPLNPRFICRVCSPGSGEGICDRHARTLKRQRSANAPRQKSVPQTQTHLPQMSAAQRRANQQAQPRDRVGKYAGKSASKWKQHVPGGSAPVAPTSLKRQKTPARPVSQRRKQQPLPSMHTMLDKPVHQKVGWVVKRWFRRKKRLLRALFSWKG